MAVQESLIPGRISHDILRCASRELSRRPFRAGITVLGYAVAVGLAVLLLGVLRFTQVAENRSLQGIGTHFVTYAPGCGNVASLTPAEIDGLLRGIIPTQCKDLCKNCTGCNKKPLDLKNEGFVFENTATRLLPTSLVDHVRRIPTVQECAPYLLFRLRDPRDDSLYKVGGFDPANPEAAGTTACARSDLIAGEFLSSDSSGLALADAGYARNRGLAVGSTVAIAGGEFRIAGIVQTNLRPAKADLYLTYPDAETAISRRLSNPLLHEMNLLFVSSKNPAVHEETVRKVKELMQSNVFASYNCYKPALEALRMKEGTVWALALVLMAGIVLLSMRSQISSVSERRREIGILKAIGWNDRIVVAQVLVESAIQSVSGGLLGGFLGGTLLLVVPLQSWLGIDGRIEGGMILALTAGGLCAGFLGGLVAGALPAVSAAREKPAEALRKG